MNHRHHRRADESGRYQRTCMPSGFQLPLNPMTPSNFMTDMSLLSSGHHPPRSGLFSQMRGMDSHFNPMLPAVTSMMSPPRLLGGDFSDHTNMELNMFDPFAGLTSMESVSRFPGGRLDGNSGAFQSTVMMMSTSTGADGKPRVEKYMKSSRGNMDRQLHEVQEMYSNTHTGHDKFAMERQLQGRGRRILRERNRNTQEMVENDEPINMEGNELEDFERNWSREAEHLPRGVVPQSRAALETSGGSSRRLRQLRS